MEIRYCLPSPPADVRSVVVRPLVLAGELSSSCARLMDGRAVVELCERTDRQTDGHTHRNTLHPARGWMGRSNNNIIS